MNQAEEHGCYARGGAAGSSLLALTVVELPNPGQTDHRMATGHLSAIIDTSLSKKGIRRAGSGGALPTFAETIFRDFCNRGLDSSPLSLSDIGERIPEGTFSCARTVGSV